MYYITYRWGIWGIHTLSDLLRGLCLVTTKTSGKTQVWWFKSVIFSHYTSIEVFFESLIGHVNIVPEYIRFGVKNIKMYELEGKTVYSKC